MSESIEMETVAAVCKLNEGDETTGSVQGQGEKEQDTASMHAADQDAGSLKPTEVDNANAEANVERQDAGRISSRERKIILLFGSFLLVVMFCMAVFVLLRLLKHF